MREDVSSLIISCTSLVTKIDVVESLLIYRFLCRMLNVSVFFRVVFSVRVGLPKLGPKPLSQVFDELPRPFLGPWILGPGSGDMFRDRLVTPPPRLATSTPLSPTSSRARAGWPTANGASSVASGATSRMLSRRRFVNTGATPSHHMLLIAREGCG